MCPKDLKLKINKNTSAVIVVHLYGNPARINEIFKICKINNIRLIEDCAQGHGASVDLKKVGTFGDISTFSFFPSKNLGCFGDGGAIVTDNKKLFKICKKISHHGGLKKNQHIIVGRNSRLDNIQAGILDIKLKKLNSWIQLRRKQGSFYKKNLNNVGDIKFIHQIKNTFHSNHLFVIKTKNRNKLKKYLYNKKIYTNIHYPKTLPELPVFRRQYLKHCQNMKAIISNKEILSLPIGEHLTFKHLRYVCLEINKFFSK
jgi:dTDP-4-amino-4,6-dideoxygalactose transaminase